MAYNKQLHYEGIPSFPIPDAYLKAALHLLVLGTSQLQYNDTINQNTREDDITIVLVGEIQKYQENYKIRADSFSVNLIHPITGIKYSKIDIRFTWDNYNQNSYLATEAKRLFGKGDSLAGAYVDEGVMDFIEGRYSLGHNRAIMLGYVLLNPIDNAITSVKKALENRRTKTNEISPIDKVQGCFNYSLMYRSTHTQKVTGGKIILYHMFVDLAS